MQRPTKTKPDGGRVRGLARDILLRVEQGGAFASILLDRAESVLPDRRDAALLHETVLGVLRHRSLLDHALAAASDRSIEELDAEVRVALRIGAYSLLFLDRVPAFAAVDSAVNLVKSSKRKRVGGAAGFVNAVLRRVAAEGPGSLPQPTPEDGPGALALGHSHPEWWVERMVRRLGIARTRDLLEANNRKAETVLCANPRRGAVADVIQRLANEGVTVEPCPLPGALRVVGGSVAASATLREGDAWVQDEASQLVSVLFDEPLGPRVADICAAPGGKTAQLAATLHANAQDGCVVALDRHLGRLGRLRKLAQRTGAHNVLPVNADMSGTSPVRGPFDQVLVDAPCSGTGTLRRHPEIRWRLRGEDLKLLASRQGRLLRAGAGLTGRGGQLLYSVCSLEPEEGEAVVERFLADKPEFSLENPSRRLPPAYRGLVDADGYLRTWPDRGGLDGFFAAKLVRNP